MYKKRKKEVEGSDFEAESMEKVFDNSDPDFVTDEGMVHGFKTSYPKEPKPSNSNPILYSHGMCLFNPDELHILG